LNHSIIKSSKVLNRETQARRYIGGLHSSIERPNAVPQANEERREQFEMKRQIVKMLVQNVLITKDKSLRVVFTWTFSLYLSRLT
jgi:hypothetical protein